jgi:hypothetical protein
MCTLVGEYIIKKRGAGVIRDVTNVFDEVTFWAFLPKT